MKYFFYLAIALLFFNVSGTPQKKDTVTVGFWNLENLFDTVHDKNMIDTEFTPEGSLKWTVERLNKKLSDQASIIKSMNNGKGPDIMGFVECEHQWLIDTMIVRHLNNKHYKLAYAESPDLRGIDNGLIYNSDIFRLANIITSTVELPKDPTRFILNVNLVYNKKDTLHVFVNHWPSRRGGEKESDINRITAAQKLRENVNKLLSYNKNSNILIVGDFNDEPGNNSILKTLDARPLFCSDSVKPSDALYNTSFERYSKKEGTLKFQDTWNLLDQVIISGGVLNGNSFKYLCGSYEIYKPEQIVTKSGKYQGTPFPTYGGKRYLGGYSDHFPVVAKFLMSSQKVNVAKVIHKKTTK